jgi:hypothetical protein
MRPWVGVLILSTLIVGVMVAVILIFASGGPELFTEEGPPPGHHHRPHPHLTDGQLSNQLGHEVSGCIETLRTNGRELYNCDGERILLKPKGKAQVVYTK